MHFPNDLQALLGINFNLRLRGIEWRVTWTDADREKERQQGGVGEDGRGEEGKVVREVREEDSSTPHVAGYKSTVPNKL